MLKKFLLISIGILLITYLVRIKPFSTTSTTPKEKISLSKVLSGFITAKSSPTATITSIDIIEGTNKERVQVGLAPLSTDVLLNKSAELKVDDMIARQYFEHESPSGKGVSDLGDDVGYEYVILGENLALGTFASSQEIVQAWMDSPGHKANILGKKYQNIGVSVKQGSYEGKKVWFAVQHFGTSRRVCPSISVSLKKDIAISNDDLKKREQEIGVLKQQLESPGASTSSSYQSDVGVFNTMVSDYNAILAISKEKITEYNSQVRNFNTCIEAFQ